jgi:hypothetical protein
MIGSISREHASDPWYLQASCRCRDRPHLSWSHLVARPSHVWMEERCPNHTHHRHRTLMICRGS